MTGIITCKAKDVVMNGKLYTIHGIEFTPYGEKLADAVIWLNGLDHYKVTKEERIRLAKILEGSV